MSEPGGILDERGLKQRPAPRRVASLRDAAAIVAAVYLGARETGTLPFGYWALPESDSPFRLYPALSAGFTYQLRRVNERLEDWHGEYAAAARLFIAAMQKRAELDLRTARDQTDLQLASLESEISSDDVTHRLAAAARQARDASGVEKEIHERAHMLALTRNPRIIEVGMRQAQPGFRAIVAPEVVKSPEPLLRVVFLHPDGLRFLLAYAKSGDAGRAQVLGAIKTARQAALEAFKTMLEDTRRTWRYPPILNFAIYQLRIDDIEGIHEYAAQLGLALTKEPFDDAIAIAQMTLAGIALAFAGPELAAIGAAAEVADFGVSLWDLRRKYLRERENELLSDANPFGVETGGPPVLTTVPVDYGDVAFNGALTLLAGLTLYKKLREIADGAKLSSVNAPILKGAPTKPQSRAQGVSPNSASAMRQPAYMGGRAPSIYEEALQAQSVRPSMRSGSAGTRTGVSASPIEASSATAADIATLFEKEGQAAQSGGREVGTASEINVRGLPQNESPMQRASAGTSSSAQSVAVDQEVLRGVEPSAPQSPKVVDPIEDWVEPIKTPVQDPSYRRGGLSKKVPASYRSTSPTTFSKDPRRARVLTLEEQQNYIQFDPKTNSLVDHRTLERFKPKPGEVKTVGPRTFEWDKDLNLVRATTTDITFGIRDSVQYANVPGLRPGVVYGHLLGIQFGTIDAQVGAFGGVLQAASMNQRTVQGVRPLWLIAENQAISIAWKRKLAGDLFEVVAEAKDFVSGVPAQMRIMVLDPTGGSRILPYDSGWILNPVPP